MAVYDGVPSIRLEGDKDRALAFVPDAKALLYRVQSFLKIADVSTFSASQRVDNGYIYVLSSSGQNIIHIAVDVEFVDTVEPEPPIPPEGKTFPSFYSGLVSSGFLESRVGPDGSYSVCYQFAPTPTCVDIHPELSSGWQSPARLAVRPFFDDLQNSGSITFSQYTRLRSSMYSGAMASVVQVILGLGRIRDTALADPLDPGAARAYRRMVKTHGVQVRYDYKFHRTHGVVRGADNRMWLVEISQARGVLAMLLPCFPGSETEAYIASAELRGDSAMVTALSELGALPTGESFPSSGTELAERIAAGTILQLLPASALSAFYENQPYSINMGWAFNNNGSEAHNTGFRFGEDGLQRGVWYLIRFNIGEVISPREPGEPLATASATVVRQAEGYLHAPNTKRGRFLPIKFYDPLLGGLRSHDGAPSLAVDNVPVCDTVMFVCFVNDELKTARFYKDLTTEQIDSFETDVVPGECLYAGSWYETTITGTRALPAMMYTNDYDDREVQDPFVQETRIESRDIGFDPPRFNDVLLSPETAYVFRRKVFKVTTDSETRSSPFIGGVVVIPQYCRETYYYATGKTFEGGRRGQTSIEYTYLKDPNVGWTWRNFPRINGPTWPSDRGCAIENCGGVYTGDGTGNRPHKERKVVCLDYEADSCSEFADSGVWLTMCETVDSFNSVPQPRRVPRTTFWDRGTDSRASLHVVSRGYNGPIQLTLEFSSFYNHWMAPSPDPDTMDVQQLLATYSCVGLDCIIFASNLYGGEILTYGYTPVNVNNDVPCFIGVNQP